MAPRADMLARRIDEPPSTPLVLSKFERVNLIALRSEQLFNGAPSTLPPHEAAKCAKVTEIAEREFALGSLPMGIARKIDNNKFRIYDLSSFINPMGRQSVPREHDAIDDV